MMDVKEGFENHERKGGNQYHYRSAEKKRKFSSHPAADLIAQLSVDAFRNTCPTELQKALKQTVLATIVMEVVSNPTDSNFHVLSFGVGTKVVSKEIIESHRTSSSANSIVRDLHAEILAKRGFQRFLYQELEKYLSSTSSSSNSCEVVQSIFEQSEGDDNLKIKDNIKFHLYTSSQPCGNACIKRWAKNDNKKDPLAAFQPHSRLYVTAAVEGQVAVLTKIHSNLRENNQKSKFESVEDALLTDGIRIFPPATAPVYTGLGNIMTCSDKIAKWNVLGLQGALLTNFLRPVYLSSVVVGRKFSEVHTRRALCCRLQDFAFVNGHLILPEQRKRSSKRKLQNPSNEIEGSKKKENENTVLSNDAGSSVYTINHPVILGTAVKFDEGALLVKYSADLKEEDERGIRIGADFQEKRCFVAWLSDRTSLTYDQEVLDGTTGEVILENGEKTPSRISSFSFELFYYSLLSRNTSLKLKMSEDAESLNYIQLKKSMIDYDQAKEILFNNSLFFSEWIKK